MTNTGDRPNYNSETVKNNPSHINSYRNGYVNGRETERNYQQNLAARDNENASVGLLLGIFLTSLAGLIVGAFWYFNQPRETVVNEAQPIVTPSPQQTTIIEKTREVPVVVPQPEIPPINLPSPPDINVTVPPQQPTNSGTQDGAQTPAGSRTNTSETTVPQSSDRLNDTSNTTNNAGTDESNSR